jgi:molecular chaperone GrpE (heat shock protein)
MNAPALPSLPRWPFYAADAALLVTACWIVAASRAPLGFGPSFLVFLCVGLAAWFCVLPFLSEYKTAVRLTESHELSDTVAEIGKLQTVADQIRQATSQWQGVQEQSGRTAASAREIADRMTAEAQAFADFMAKANDAEKGTLRLEIEKQRRAEGDWLQTLVRLLDHVYALHQAGVRSGQQNVIQNLASFQNACREAARRVGLAAFEAEPDELFDPERHHVVQGEPDPVEGSRVRETVATGFTYQGRLIRQSLVRLARESSPEQETPAESTGAVAGDAPAGGFATEEEIESPERALADAGETGGAEEPQPGAFRLESEISLTEEQDGSGRSA